MTTLVGRPLPGHLSFLQPLVMNDLARFGNKNDGGYLLPLRSIDNLDALLSFGLADNWIFEKDLKDRFPDLLIHTYDHTVRPSVDGKILRRSIFKGLIKLFLFQASIPEVYGRIRAYREHKLFFFRRCTHFEEKIFNRRDNDSDATIGQVFSRVPGKSNVLLKMDIEGGEYRVIPQILEFSKAITLMVIEFHDTELYRELFEKRVKEILADFEIVHLHGNNFIGTAADGLPEVLEITFLKRKFIAPNSPRREVLPIPGLDAPNNPLKSDLPFAFATCATSR